LKVTKIQRFCFGFRGRRNFRKRGRVQPNQPSYNWIPILFKRCNSEYQKYKNNITESYCYWRNISKILAKYIIHRRSVGNTNVWNCSKRFIIR